ncbi:31471_t:CDS:1, partial [Gigaspora margarita]
SAIAEMVLQQSAPTTNIQNREKVLKYNTKLGSKIGGKLEEKWNGPYQSHEALGNSTYKLRTIDWQEQVLVKVVYGSQLKK